MILKCPNCHTEFQVERDQLASVIQQVRNAEFDEELSRRVAEVTSRNKAEERARMLEQQQKADRVLADKDREIDRLRAEAKSFDNDLRSRMQVADAQHKLDIANERAKNEREIAELNSLLTQERAAAKTKVRELSDMHAAIVRAKDEEIEHYKDLKARLSTKMLGETLEQHCLNMFNRARSQGQFLTAYFEKDNDTSVDGTKGDFIFRDFLDGDEYISIMFEMKNEADTTLKRHRNEDFFAKLDKDRRDKQCEYAVLVSTLEADSELYNEGIVDVSYRYDKMFVIRPQFFMSVITMLSRAAHRGAQRLISLRHEVEIAKAQSIDVTNFEERRDRFTADFMKYVAVHQKKHTEAIEAIDKAIEDAERQIAKLRKIKDIFTTSEQKLTRAGEVLENDFTIKKLTRGNPTMREEFERVRRLRQTTDPEE